MTVDPGLRLSDFDYELPQELIAQVPLVERDASRLLVVNRTTGELIHSAVRSLPDWLEPGDMLVVNNSRVIPARVFARKATGGRVEFLLLHRDPGGTWTALARPAKSLRAGMRLFAGEQGSGTEIEVIEKAADGEVFLRFTGEGDGDLDRIGAVPLPPYIRAKLERDERYQTIYARVPGSSAAPTAGLHITEALRAALLDKGIGWAEVTLHIGLDTFRPVTVERVSEHPIHAEWCRMPAETAQALLNTRASGKRVIAVGTTSARTLELWSRMGTPAAGFEAWADLFITPGYRWGVVDAMLTNFHLPRSTLLMMISSFAGTALVRRAYAEAIADRYRFFSFGDAMLIL